MSKTRLLQIVLIVDSALLLLFVLATVVFSQADPAASATEVPSEIVNTIPLPPTVTGVVVDGKGPVAGAVVQIQGKDYKTQTDANGAFSVSGITGTTPIFLTAWSAGH